MGSIWISKNKRRYYRMEQAKTLYEGAKEEYQRALAHYNDLGATHPDGSLARATRIETFALQAYARALMDFNHFVLDEKLPEDQDSARDWDTTGAPELR